MTEQDLDPRIAPIAPYSALIFDCDGTLADTMPTHYVAWLTALRAHGGDMSEELFYASAGKPTRDILADLNKRFGYGLNIEQVYEEKENLYLKSIDSVTEIKAIVDVARANFGKVPLAVASGGSQAIVRSTLDVLKITELFSAIVGADDVVHGKPHPDLFLLAAEKLQVPPEKCIVYEDGDPGVVAAERAGMRVIDIRVLFAI